MICFTATKADNVLELQEILLSILKIPRNIPPC